MTPTELRKLLEPHGIRPIKDRSQHFLLDENVVVAMADAAGVKEGECVLEIGPGPGILTAELLRRGAQVAAVELDRKLCELLRGRFGTSKNFHLLEGDALSFSNAELAAAFSEFTAYSVVANLPYAITSAILQKFLLERPAPSSITVMVQKEVADRLLAKPGDMSSLAVLAQTYARVSRVRNVAAGAFFPPPKVASSVIHMELRDATELDAFFEGVPAARYFVIVRKAFSEPRKQLRNSLRSLAPDAAILESAFVKAKISPSSRPEELSTSQWSTLAKGLRSEPAAR